MTKNILVTDERGNIVGTTYPKRARGLVKSGRAEFVDGSTICLRTDVADAFRVQKRAGEDGPGGPLPDGPGEELPWVAGRGGRTWPSFLEFREVNDMANEILFSARDFRLVKECETNRGTRLMVTENFKNVECFELAEDGSPTQISRELELSAGQDYVFRFAIRSRVMNVETADCLVDIYFEDPEDGYTYPLDRDDKNRFRPTICKKTGEELLRVFDLPFHSGSSTKCTIVFSVAGMTAWVYPVLPMEEYDIFEDVDYDTWRQDEDHRIMRKISELGSKIGEGASSLGGTLGGKLSDWGDRLSRAASGRSGRNAKSGEGEVVDGVAREVEPEAAKEEGGESAPETEGDGSGENKE